MSLPIIKFKNETEAIKCLKDWMDIFNLNEWIIGINLSNEKTKSPNWGQSLNWRTIRVAKIKIFTINEYDNFPAKYCQELILVHELMHIKLLPCDSNDEIVRAEFHAILEELAKGYLMARYNLDFEWFKNDRQGDKLWD